MNSNLPPPTPHRWRVALSCHIDDMEIMELAINALYENLEGVWVDFIQKSDDDELSVTIILKWLDKGMLQIVRSIIEAKYDEVQIIYNGGVNENGDRITI